MLLLSAPHLWNTSIFTKLVGLKSAVCSDWPAIQWITIGWIPQACDEMLRPLPYLDTYSMSTIWQWGQWQQYYSENKGYCDEWGGAESRGNGAVLHTKHKLKSRPGPLSSSTVVTPPFIPSEAPPWDSRPVSGAGVVHYHLLHRPRSVPTALGPAPLVTVMF